MVEMRRFPRIPYSQAAELELFETGETRRLEVHFRSISCHGAGIASHRDDVAKIWPGRRVNLLFAPGDERMVIPARVVWAVGSHAGLRLLVGSLADDDRNAYASWIVPLTNKAVVAAARG